MSNSRNYDAELLEDQGRTYVYDFEEQVMHGYELKTFQPFFRPGNALELGCHKGTFTKKLFPLFQDLTCAEASPKALAFAKGHLPARIEFHEGIIEELELPRRYDNVFLTHVLEHLDDPVVNLRIVKERFMAPNGRFFICVPNANSISRQIAVNMGVVSHNSAVLPSERDGGHRITYSLDTLCRDARAAGLTIEDHGGIFLKTMASYQWDKLLKTDIITPGYIEGCYQLGKVYPDLCGTIYIICS